MKKYFPLTGYFDAGNGFVSIISKLATLSLASLLFWQPLYGIAQSDTAQMSPKMESAGSCTSSNIKLDEKKFVLIGGIQQWITISGTSCDNPLILFLHGGPGNSLSPYADAIYGAWQSEFTLVQWDQRGAGKTFAANPATAESALTLERMARDGIELTEYLTRQFGKRKVILMGGSWGSILGIHMIKSRPDLFSAYVGSGQIVSYRDNQSASYTKLISLARAADDQKTVSTIEALGPPPWTNPRNSGILRRATRIYEAKTSAAAPKAWWVPAPGYATAQMQDFFEQADDYSYLQFVGLKGDGMFSRIDLPKLGMRFDIPVYIIEGSEDLVAVPDVAKRYFDGLVAPDKEYVTVPRTGHDPNQAMVDAQHKILSEKIRPMAK
ncbi:MAG: alpha/beta hydrolase [Collimonas pratensis]|uniref:alpha/beta fold hydrolase n=1 Tax=Collimonas pratensis TaxID=279113 RepID=UPI003C7596D8